MVLQSHRCLWDRLAVLEGELQAMQAGDQALAQLRLEAQQAEDACAQAEADVGVN